MPPILRSKISPNYLLPPVEVYKNTFLEYFYISRRLDTLGMSDIYPRQENLPSWVPDWSIEDQSPPLCFSSEIYTSGFSSASIKYLPPNTLEITGLHHSTICSVYSPVDTISDYLELVQHLKLDTLCDSATYITGEYLLDAYASVLSLARLRERSPDITRYPSLEVVKDLFKSSIIETESVIKEEDHFHESNILYLDMFRLAKGRRFFQTKEGYFGLGTRSTQKGENIQDYTGIWH
jgi:hypothetical protein